MSQPGQTIGPEIFLIDFATNYSSNEITKTVSSFIITSALNNLYC